MPDPWDSIVQSARHLRDNPRTYPCCGLDGTIRVEPVESMVVKAVDIIAMADEIDRLRQIEEDRDWIDD